MADTDPKNLNSKADGEESEIGSGPNTPPGGASTPRPDLVDKRLPGLNYFAQVRNAPSSARSSMHSATSHNNDSASTHGLLTAPNSPKTNAVDARKRPRLASKDQLQEQSAYPTPPLSSSSSMKKLSDAWAGSGQSKDDGSTRRGTFTSQKRRRPASPTKLRRHTLTSSTLSSVVTTPSITGEISNPAASIKRESESSNPVVTRSSSPPRSASKAKRVLTLGFRRLQNTPPQTPRALSHESRQDDTTTGHTQVASGLKNSRSSSSNSAQPPTSQTKGVLHVSIVEGRGLRPSTAPYVVCIFQLNEDISEGAQGDAMDTRQDNGPEKDEDLARGVAMRRIGSDQGKPIGIPGMRSRQSSQTNIAQLKHSHQNKEITDPVWKHNATLYVIPSLPCESTDIDLATLLVTTLRLTYPYTTRRTKRPSLGMSALARIWKTTSRRTRAGISSSQERERQITSRAKYTYGSTLNKQTRGRTDQKILRYSN